MYSTTKPYYITRSRRDATARTNPQTNERHFLSAYGRKYRKHNERSSYKNSTLTQYYHILVIVWVGSVAEWLACWTQALKGPGSNRSRDAVG